MATGGKYLPHYSVKDYLQWEGDWELLSGIAVAMTPSPFGPHQVLAGAIAAELRNQLKWAHCDCVVIPELDWIVDDHTVVRPDVAVVCGEVPARHLEETPALVVEVLSPATEEKDRMYKRELYGKQGVRWYLLADPVRRKLEVLELSKNEYAACPEQPIYEIELCPGYRIRLDVGQL